MKFSVLVVLALALSAIACQPEKKPVGYSNPQALLIEKNNWKSSDTIISVDPQTFEETMRVVENDYSPIRLSDGTLLYQLTEYLPVFNGCETDEDPAICTQLALNKFVSDNLEYPRWAKVRGLQGTSIATFVIGEDGKVGGTGIERSLGDEIDKLVMQLIERMPIWTPGFHNGEPVAVQYRLPVQFELPLEE